jgi:Coenzyme PQQ synthesis protein D (PqqD)
MEGESYCVNEPSVISEVIDGETVVLNFESGHYYSFNPTASEIWLRLCAGSPVPAVIEWVARRFAVEPAADVETEVAAFVRRLEEERLIRRATPNATDAPSAPPAVDPSAGPLASFSSPTFEKFTDMEELLLLDPIHEVGESGWPRKA